MDGASVMLADPSRGLKTMSADDFAKSWNGVIFVITDNVKKAEVSYNSADDRKIIPRGPAAVVPMASAIWARFS